MHVGLVVGLRSTWLSGAWSVIMVMAAVIWSCSIIIRSSWWSSIDIRFYIGHVGLTMSLSSWCWYWCIASCQPEPVRQSAWSGLWCEHPACIRPQAPQALVNNSTTCYIHRCTPQCTCFTLYTPNTERLITRSDHPNSLSYVISVWYKVRAHITAWHSFTLGRGICTALQCSCCK